MHTYLDARKVATKNIRREATAAKRGRKPPPENETKREKFLRLAHPRLIKAIKAVRVLTNFARGDYEWDDRDVIYMETMLQRELNELKQAFSRGGKKRAITVAFPTGEQPVEDAFEVERAH